MLQARHRGWQLSAGKHRSARKNRPQPWCHQRVWQPGSVYLLETGLYQQAGGPTRLTTESSACPAVARRCRQGGPGCQVLLRVLPRPCLVPTQGLPENTSIPRCGQAGLLGRAKVGSSWGHKGRARAWGRTGPTHSCAPPGQGPEEASLVGKGWRSHPACTQEPAPFILYCLQEASRPLASPRDPLSRWERSPDTMGQVGDQLTADFRKFWLALGRWPMTHPGTSGLGSECAYPKGT